MLSQGMAGVGTIPANLHGPDSPSNRPKKWSEAQMRESFERHNPEISSFFD
jgi:hypothetical protein